MEGVADLVGTAVRAAVESQAGRPQSTGPSSATTPSIPPLPDRFIEAAERGLHSELDEMFDRHEVANRTVLGSLRHEIVTLGRVPQEARVALARMTPLADASGEICEVASSGKFVQGTDGSVTYVASSDAEGKEAQSVAEELHKLRMLLPSCVLVSMDLDTSKEAAPGELATVRRLAARCPRGETLAVSPSAVRQFLAAAELLRSWQLRTVRHVVGGALATWRRRANNPVELDRYSISAALRKGGQELRALALAGEAAQIVPADASAAAAASDAASAPPGKVIISEGHYEDLTHDRLGIDTLHLCLLTRHVLQHRGGRAQLRYCRPLRPSKPATGRSRDSRPAHRRGRRGLPDPTRDAGSAGRHAYPSQMQQALRQGLGKKRNLLQRAGADRPG